MILYLFKMMLCLTLFLGAYRMLLENEKMYYFNRWYLLISIVVAFVIPLIMIPTPDPIPIFFNIENVLAPKLSGEPKSQLFTTNALKLDLFIQAAIILYAIITMAFLFRFLINFYKICLKASKNKQIAFQCAKIVLLKETVIPHTFLNNIFVNKTAFESGLIEEEILIHELTHVRERHSFDVIFIELLSIFCWFNPILRFYKQAIVMNHEFLADSKVIETSNNIKQYQQLLLSKIEISPKPQLTTSFNFYLTKKRLIMMQKSTQPRTMFLKTFLLIPVLAIAIMLFSENAEATTLKAIVNKATINNPQKRHLKVAEPKSRIDQTTVKKKSNFPVIKAKSEIVLKALEQSSEKVLQPESDSKFTDKSRNGISISAKYIWLSINHHTTKAQLAAYGKMLREKNIVLEISNDEYDEKGKLKYIKIAVTCLDNKKFTGTVMQSVDAEHGVGFYRLFQTNSEDDTFEMLNK